jgi:hypothetical protein
MNVGARMTLAQFHSDFLAVLSSLGDIDSIKMIFFANCISHAI